MTEFSLQRNRIVYASPAMHIGKTQWRFVVLTSLYGAGYSTDYEWLNTSCSDSGVWYPSRERKGYNGNDGMYAGLPKTLRKLWDRYSHEYENRQSTMRSVKS